MTPPSSSSTRDVTFQEADAWNPKLLPLGDALPSLSMSNTQAYRLIARNQFPIPVVRVGKLWFVRSVDLDNLLNPP